MVVHDIPDLQRDGADLGSVVFSESFLESSINIQQKGTILITLSLVRMDCWLIPQRKFDLHNKQDKTTVFCEQKYAKVILKQQSTSLKIAYFLPWGSYLWFIFHVCHSLALLFMLHFKQICFLSCRWHCVLRQLLHHSDYNCASLCLLAGMCGTENQFQINVINRLCGYRLSLEFFYS